MRQPDHRHCFEVWPTSNVLTGAAASVRDHPVVEFLRSGCHVVLGDDDPTTTGVRLPQEAALLAQEGMLDHRGLAQIARNSIRVALCDDAVRADLGQRLAEETHSPGT